MDRHVAWFCRGSGCKWGAAPKGRAWASEEPHCSIFVSQVRGWNTLIDILVTSFSQKQSGAVILTGQVSCNESLSSAQMGPHMHCSFHSLRLCGDKRKQLWPLILPAWNNIVAINKWTTFSLNMQLHGIDYRSDKTQNNSTNTELGSDFYQYQMKVV